MKISVEKNRSETFKLFDPLLFHAIYGKEKKIKLPQNFWVFIYNFFQYSDITLFFYSFNILLLHKPVCKSCLWVYEHENAWQVKYFDTREFETLVRYRVIWSYIYTNINKHSQHITCSTSSTSCVAYLRMVFLLWEPNSFIFLFIYLFLFLFFANLTVFLRISTDVYFGEKIKYI